MTLEIMIASISIMIVLSQVFIVHFFIKKINTLQKKIFSLQNMVAQAYLKSQVPQSKFEPRFMEGDLDLVFKGQKASVRAVFHPRKIS